jgi:hypothetical protein
MKMSSFKNVPLKVVGQTYEHRSTAVSIQKTMRLIPQAEVTGAAESSLTSWPGCTVFSTNSGSNRGMTVFKNELYKVNSTTLIKIDSLGTASTLGTIAGSNRCIFANDGTNMIITTGGNGYQLTGTTLTQITDTDYESANSVSYLNQQMIYDGNGGRFQVSDVGNPDSLQPNNFATAESSPDDTIRTFAFRERVYIFGERSIETWYNSGSGNPPFARVNGGTMNVGLSAVHSVAATDDYCYFLGDDRRVYRFSSHQAQNITSIAISHQIFNMGNTGDAIASIFHIEGQSFYVIAFPSAGKTLAFNEDAGAWFTLSTGADESRYIGDEFIECYGKRLISDKDNGNVHELSLTTFTDNGETCIQERILGPINGTVLGIPAERIMMSYVDLVMEMGVGIETGQGSNPQLLVSASFDGGDSFTNEDDVLLGRTGQGRLKARWDHTESFYSAFIRIRCSDPVFISLFSGSIGIKGSGF